MRKLTKFDYLKIGVIPCLLGVLFAVLPWPDADPNGSSNTSKTASVANDIPSDTRSARVRNEITVPKESVPHTQWPSFQLSELRDIDPFDRRMIFPELQPQTPAMDATLADRQSLVAITALPLAKRLEAFKIQAVFQSPRGIAALVGERVIHVGDRLEDGTEVIGITPEQLEIAATDSY